VEVLEQTAESEWPVSPDRQRPGRARTRDGASDIHIRNAGVIIAAPYLPRLFTMTGLIENNAFHDTDSAHRAVHLLQYMADGSTQPSEHLITLNKILCGLDFDAPVKRQIDLLDGEKETVDSLLQAVIAHWTAIGKTSVEGLRESFLQREGRLRMLDGIWQLLVEPKAFDMLLDKLPWSFSMIRFPWMNTGIRVDWR
jgi:hypothetical protein